jgi:hypothetical protein
MMKRLIIVFGILLSSLATAHHYKGLPHYSYFENYPQVPILEFIERDPDYEFFVTIYNFQGLNLDLVESPDDVRFYSYIYDVNANSAYKGKVDFEIWSHKRLIMSVKALESEQENIYIIQDKIEEQDDLILKAKFLGSKGETKIISMPIQITEGFLDKYGLIIAIIAFFAAVMSIKLFTQKQNQARV